MPAVSVAASNSKPSGSSKATLATYFGDDENHVAHNMSASPPVALSDPRPSDASEASATYLGDDDFYEALVASAAPFVVPSSVVEAAPTPSARGFTSPVPLFARLVPLDVPSSPRVGQRQHRPGQGRRPRATTDSDEGCG